MTLLSFTTFRLHRIRLDNRLFGMKGFEMIWHKAFLRSLAGLLPVFLLAEGFAGQHQMDLLIGKTRKDLKGGDRYIEQQNLAMRIRNRGRFFFRAEHDLTQTNGTLLGDARLRLRGAGRNLKVTVLRIDGGGRKDVTRQITGRKGLALPGFVIDDSAEFLVKMKRDRNSTKRRKVTLNFAKLQIIGILVALMDTSRDKVQAKVRFR